MSAKRLPEFEGDVDASHTNHTGNAEWIVRLRADAWKQGVSDADEAWKQAAKDSRTGREPIENPYRQPPERGDTDV